MEYLLIALAIILSGPIAPFVIIIKSLINRFKWKKLIKSYNERFWLNETEKNEFLDYHNNYNILQEEIDKIQNSINEINNIANKENISRNSDGSISNRSNRGKVLNKELSLLYNELSSTKSKQSRFGSEIWWLKNKPQSFWEELKENFIPYYTYLYTFYFWLICFYLMVSYFFKKPSLALYEMFSYLFLGQKKFILLKEGWGFKIILILIGCALLSLLFNLLIELIIKKYVFKKKYPQPPIVTLNNYDNY
jgi:hypothetical protein